MKKARCVPTIVSAALSLAFPLHSVFSYLKKNEEGWYGVQFPFSIAWIIMNISAERAMLGFIFFAPLSD